MKTLAVIVWAICLSGLALAQDTKPSRIKPVDAKGHVGETATICGKVVDNVVSKNGGLGGYGWPVYFYLDQPATPNPVFYFVTFGAKAQSGAPEVVDAYNGKRVCVTGKIEMQAGRPPFILATDRSQIKPEAKNTQ